MLGWGGSGALEQPRIDQKPALAPGADDGCGAMTTARDKGTKWMTATRPYRRQWAIALMPCALCHEPIDYVLHRSHRDSLTVDHIVALMNDGPMFDPTNWQPSHRRCNAAKGNRDRQARKAAAKAVTSWRW